MWEGFAGPWALLAFVLLVLAAAWAVCRPHVRGASETVVGVAAWSAATVIASVTALSSLAVLTGWHLLALTAVIAVAAWTWRVRRGWPARGEPTPSVDPWSLAFVVPIGIFAAGMALAIWSGPETGPDNLAYHLPRLGYWQQQRAVAPFVAGNARAGSFPPNGNVLQLPPVLFLGHDRFCGTVQLLAAVFTAAAVHGVARGLGATGFAASMAALCWMAIPCMLEQAGRSLVDVTASFFVAAAAFFVVRFPAGSFGPLSTIACGAIAVGTKTHTLVLVLPLAAASLWRLRADRRTLLRTVLAAPLVWLALGGAYQLQCARVWSDPGGLASIRWVVLSPSLVSLRKNVELVAYSWSSLGQGGAGAPMRRVLWKAATGYGFGLAWPLLCALTGAMLLASSRRPRARTWAAWWAAGVGGALVLCFALRHQDAVLRFLLPAAALVTPTFAWTFDRMGRSVVTRSAVAALGLVGVGLMAWRWVGHERAMRHRDGRPLAPHERFGPDLQPLAAAVAALPEPAGARLGLLTPDYFPEGVFFGRRYRNHLVPLSYALPQGLGEIEALQLDALWVDTLEHCTMVLFRRDFARPAARPQRNRRAHPEGYDEDFSQAYGESVERVDLKPTLRALADPASTWSVWQTTPQGVLLVKAPGRRVDPRELCGAP